MLKKKLALIVFIVLASVVNAQNSDFNNDGKVDFDDFFLFAENSILRQMSLTD